MIQAFIEISNFFASQITKEAARMGLTTLQFQVLYFLKMNRKASLVSISDHVDLPAQVIQTTLKNLITLHLISEETGFQLTKIGAERVQESMKHLQETLPTVFTTDFIDQILCLHRTLFKGNVIYL